MDKIKEIEAKIQKAREMQLHCVNCFLNEGWPDRFGAVVGIDDWFFEEMLLQKELDELTRNQNQG